MSDRITPMMAQFLEMKAAHPDSLLLFRMGDFYELFFDDAKDASRLLGLTLTTRGKHQGSPIPMAGVPWHSISGYIRRLIDAGCRVAVCEQVEDPKAAKGIVRREVVEVITPGTYVADDADATTDARYTAAVCPPAKSGGPAGLSLLDVSTGEFTLGEFELAAIGDELLRYRPAEVVTTGVGADHVPSELATHVTELDDPMAFRMETAMRVLSAQFGTADLDGFGCRDLTVGVAAAGALFEYVSRLRQASLGHVTALRVLSPVDTLVLDAVSLAHLDVIDAAGGGRSLRDVVDGTSTAMGARRLRHDLACPSRNVAAIAARHDAVGALVADTTRRRQLGDALDRVYDLERLAGKLGSNRATPRDLAALRDTLHALPSLRDQATLNGGGRLNALATDVDPLPEVAMTLERAIGDAPPVNAGDGGVFRPGYAADLDELTRAAEEGRTWIADLQQAERERTGIAKLKVGYNKVFGYFIEVTRSNLANVPDYYQRKQTLVGAERFITEELKEKEILVLGAEERRATLEVSLFETLRDEVAQHVPSLSRTARAIGEIDVLRGFAEVAVARRYVRPEVRADGDIHIVGGRHPIVEDQIGAELFIANDCHLDGTSEQVHLITGPNMAGKSTYLRQVGLLVLLAQAGSFVPATSAVIAACDRIFTRVGASDNAARGQSTFLVEMHESANILNNATSRSLVLLDEVGRGTSTFDGLSIAWAMTEHLHHGMATRPLTLFATHFHELTRLADELPRVKNYRVDVRERGKDVVFLHTIVAGSADRSYGIHVARMAGLPAPVVKRAGEILSGLEAGNQGAGPVQTSLPLGHSSPEPGSPAPPSPSAVEQALIDADLEHMTPIEALGLLARLREEAGTSSEAPG